MYLCNMVTMIENIYRLEFAEREKFTLTKKKVQNI